MKLILTCEHGGNEVPAEYWDLFQGAEDVLQSHRGWDPGALDLYATLLQHADAGWSATVTRLLVELNRTLGHPELFSEYSRVLGPADRERVLAIHYAPFRLAVADRIAGYLNAGHAVLHVSVHSFTPVLDGKPRDLEVGLLYDPAHGRERVIARDWKDRMQELAKGWRIRMNQPYKGTADGHTKALREFFGERYAGIELEVRNDWLLDPQASVLVRSVISIALQELQEASDLFPGGR
ncbi:MAG: N-formylglutamate amidohydrolase [Flavobacteriales bacterium]|nr:N-formylglutamate amidohydrolase [Flavobacteriales bacterium]MCB0787442.1 N-formylglutamate amidohydrolase [Flavobacteriales bacterium]MCB0810892.1 N-formylglutamate amidohydrolase [Flavobacteriales bacterium]